MSFEVVVSEDLIRITGHQTKDKNTLLKGVPIKHDHLLKSATYSVQVWSKSDLLPVQPAMGQIWKVEGAIDKQKFTKGHYELEVRVYQNPRTLEFSLPHDGETFIQFIAKDPEFKGIGESKARQLWARFGPSIHDILQENGAQHLDELRELLTDKIIKSLYQGYAKYQNLKHTLWMSKACIPAPVQRRILKHHKDQTVSTIKSNPYELANFGLKIQEVDQLLMQDGVWERRTYPVERYQMAAGKALNQLLKNGSTYTKPSLVRAKIFDIIKNHEHADKAVEYLKTNMSIAVYNEAEDRLHPASTAIQELAVAKRFKHLASVEDRSAKERIAYPLKKVLGELDFELTAKQIEAVKNSLSNQISCITGGAGTGKTTVLNTLLKTAAKVGYEIHAVALSGRAAMRLHESIGFFTSTIARFLREERVYCSPNQLKLLVIDEASMMDLPTMFKIINHTCPNTKLIFTGDPNQLPPIGKGKILHDLVESGLVVNTTLDIVKRQKGDTGIPVYSKQVNDGVVPKNLSYGNIFHYDVPESAIHNTVMELYALSPDNTKVIAPTRNRVDQINDAIQSRFNSDSPLMQLNLDATDYYLQLRLGDKILFTRNHNTLGVQNGSIGELVSVEQDGESFGVVKLDTGEHIEVTQALLDCIQLGYAITLYKAQGSQFKNVIAVLQDGPITDRSWLYTALTRAEVEVHIVGPAQVFRTVTENPPTAFKRKTLLKQLMRFID